MKRNFIIIAVFMIIAAFFYAAIWTNNKFLIYECFLYTGIVALGQLFVTVFIISMAKDLLG